MTPRSETAETPVPSETTPPSSHLHWLFLAVSLLLLALVLLSGMLAFRFLSELRAQELRATRALAERTRALSGLWLSVQSYDQAVQQFLAEASADDKETRRRLDQLAVEIVSSFDRYPADRDTQENALLTGMRRVFADRRTMYVTILTATPAERRRQSEKMLAENVGPLQKQILDWSEKLQAWNGSRLQNADRAVSEGFADAQGSLSRALAIAFGSGLLLVLASLAYIIRLDRQTRRR